MQHWPCLSSLLKQAKLFQSIPLDISLYFVVQNCVTSLLLATKETDKVSIELGTSPTQTQVASVSKKNERKD